MRTLTIIIFGCGHGGLRALNVLLPHEKVTAFCDNDPSKHGETIGNFPIVSPQDLSSMDYDIIVIASQHKDAIQTQLISMGIPATKIETLEQDALLGRSSSSSRIERLSIQAAVFVLTLGFPIVRAARKLFPVSSQRHD